LSGKPCIFIATSDSEKWQFVVKLDLSMFVKVS
jgi:hypothetical protein